MADFQTIVPELHSRQARIVAFSVDSKEQTQELVDSLGLSFPVGYGLDPLQFAEATGAFYETRRNIIHATEFVLNKDGSLLGSVFSSGPAGRYDAQAVLRIIDAAIAHAAK